MKERRLIHGSIINREMAARYFSTNKNSYEI